MEDRKAIQKWILGTPKFESDLINPVLSTSPWSGHRHFAYDLVRFTRPKKIVELGTHYGCSFFLFLQAVKDFNINTELYAIDTWKGDEHAGFYGEEVYTIVCETISKFYSSQSSKLLRMTFDDALNEFPDNSIEMLHIDGFHSYDAVKYDYETWFDKLAPNGIVLFHDVSPDPGYGSADYWKEIKLTTPYIEFLDHSFGLGVLFPKGEYWRNSLQQVGVIDWLNYYLHRANSELFYAQKLAAEKMLEERSSVMQSMEKMIRERDEAMQSMEKMIRERDELIKDQQANMKSVSCLSKCLFQLIFRQTK